ncbi:MAG: sensor domain-containing diguanylate cyclase [Gemmatimonadetes bacterium]|nr:sensor domain-containing diguanylate cyclase [Gemmatimonadota bacterium]
MEKSLKFFEAVVNSVTEHIVVVDAAGVIECVNTAWVGFGIDNGSRMQTAEDWLGVDYFRACNGSPTSGDGDGPAVAKGLRRVIDGQVGVFSHEYACHSTTERRWFMMRITPLEWEGPARYVISHHNITGRKLAEERVQALSLKDGLTGLPNRRRFDDFVASEWRRGLRDRAPVSLLLIDIDHFKLFNDHYGHTVGDECLQKVARAIGDVARRPADLAARYGGEEFAVVLGGTDEPAAHRLAIEALEAVAGLRVPHDASPTAPIVTVSVGVATMVPEADSGLDTLLVAADEALYAAKRGGRSRVEVWTP